MLIDAVRRRTGPPVSMQTAAVKRAAGGRALGQPFCRLVEVDDGSGILAGSHSHTARRPTAPAIGRSMHGIGKSQMALHHSEGYRLQASSPSHFARRVLHATGTFITPTHTPLRPARPSRRDWGIQGSSMGFGGRRVFTCAAGWVIHQGSCAVRPLESAALGSGKITLQLISIPLVI